MPSVPSAEPSAQPAVQAPDQPVDGEQAAVQVQGLAVRFGEVDAVRDIDLVVPSGGSVALVGRNGAGKSTTLRVLAGVVPASEGVVRVGGVDVRRRPQQARRPSRRRRQT